MAPVQFVCNGIVHLSVTRIAGEKEVVAEVKEAGTQTGGCNALKRTV